MCVVSTHTDAEATFESSKGSFRHLEAFGIKVAGDEGGDLKEERRRRREKG